MILSLKGIEEFDLLFPITGKVLISQSIPMCEMIIEQRSASRIRFLSSGQN